jgi:hypothetical protein
LDTTCKKRQLFFFPFKYNATGNDSTHGSAVVWWGFLRRGKYAVLSLPRRPISLFLSRSFLSLSRYLTCSLAHSLSLSLSLSLPHAHRPTPRQTHTHTLSLILECVIHADIEGSSLPRVAETGYYIVKLLLLLLLLL